MGSLTKWFPWFNLVQSTGAKVKRLCREKYLPISRNWLGLKQATSSGVRVSAGMSWGEKPGCNTIRLRRTCVTAFQIPRQFPVSSLIDHGKPEACQNISRGLQRSEDPRGGIKERFDPGGVAQNAHSHKVIAFPNAHRFWHRSGRNPGSVSAGLRFVATSGYYSANAPRWVIHWQCRSAFLRKSQGDRSGKD
jgi:hypothetical protein